MENNANFLLEQSARCRRLASQVTDRELARSLIELGEQYARQAATISRPGDKERPILSAH